MLKVFELNEINKYHNFKKNNKNYIDIKNNFNNGYVIRDKFNIIPNNIVKKYSLIDITGDITNQDTEETYKDDTKYLIKDLEVLKDLINTSGLQFICLYKVEHPF